MNYRNKDRLMMTKSVLILFILIFLSGCSSLMFHDSPKGIGHRESGKASYYATKFQGRKTASGERFNQASKTAAHKSLPFGTKVKVTNVKNGRSVVVRVNDRGPFVKGRIIDLSQAAFSSIGNLSSGVIKVEIEVVD